jgi:glycosidase
LHYIVRNVWQLFPNCATGFSTSNETWLPVNKNYLWLNLEAQQFVQNSHYNVYTQLTELRKKPAFQRGETKVAALSEQVLGFTRCLSYFRLTYFDFSWYRKFSGGGRVVIFWIVVLIEYGEERSANRFFSWYLLRKM